MLCNGKQSAAGTIADIDVAPQQHASIQLEGYKRPTSAGEYVLQVEYRIKNDEQLLKAGHIVAKQEFVLSPYIYPSLEQVKLEMPIRPLTNSKVKPAVTKDEQLACIILNSATTTVTINKNTGFIDYIDVNGKPILEDGYSLKPDFGVPLQTMTMVHRYKQSLVYGRTPHSILKV